MTDVTVCNHGTLWAFEVHSDSAYDWFRENVQTEAYQWWGCIVGIEHRYAPAIVEGLREDGFAVEGER